MAVAVTIDDLLRDDSDDTSPLPKTDNPTGLGVTKNPVVPGWPGDEDETKAKDLSEQDKFLRRHNITGTMDTRFKDMLDAKERERNEQLRLYQNKKQQDEQTLAAIKNLQQPKLPTLKDIPSAPPSDAYQYQNPFLAFQNPGVFLALMASFATRTPLTAAFNSAAAAMKGFHEGDKQAIDQNVEHWKDSVEQAIKQNKIETDKYTELWNKYHDNYEKLLAELQAHAAGFKDDIMLSMLRNAGPKEFWEDLQHRIQAGEQLELSIAHVQEAKAKAEEAHTKAQSYANARITPEALDNGVKQMIAGATMQEVFPNIGRGVQGEATRNLIQNEFARQMAENGLSASDILDRRNRRAASRAGAVSEARAAGTQAAGLDLIAREVQKQIPDTLAAADKVARTGWIPINAIANWSQTKLMSNPNYRDFQAANLSLAELWGRSMNPRGVMRESDRDFALSLLNVADSPASYRKVVERLRKSVDRMREAVKEYRAEHLANPEDKDFPEGTGKKIYEGSTPGASGTAAPAAPAATEPDKEGWIDLGNGLRIKPADEAPPPGP